jgi:hypothetical protein
MLYALLAYHDEPQVQAWSEPEDAQLMSRLEQAHAAINAAARLGPAARLGATGLAVTVRAGLVTDGPFAETREALLGLYVLEAADQGSAVDAALTLQAANPSAVYEVRPIVLFRPGDAIPLTDAGTAAVRPRASSGAD